jgi:hypothetical protein
LSAPPDPTTRTSDPTPEEEDDDSAPQWTRAKTAVALVLGSIASYVFFWVFTALWSTATDRANLVLIFIFFIALLFVLVFAGIVWGEIRRNQEKQAGKGDGDREPRTEREDSPRTDWKRLLPTRSVLRVLVILGITAALLIWRADLVEAMGVKDYDALPRWVDMTICAAILIIALVVAFTPRFDWDVTGSIIRTTIGGLAAVAIVYVLVAGGVSCGTKISKDHRAYKERQAEASVERAAILARAPAAMSRFQRAPATVPLQEVKIPADGSWSQSLIRPDGHEIEFYAPPEGMPADGLKAQGRRQSGTWRALEYEHGGWPTITNYNEYQFKTTGKAELTLPYRVWVDPKKKK